jgi:hypothetical protein
MRIHEVRHAVTGHAWGTCGRNGTVHRTFNTSLEFIYLCQGLGTDSVRFLSGLKMTLGTSCVISRLFYPNRSEVVGSHRVGTIPSKIPGQCEWGSVVSPNLHVLLNWPLFSTKKHAPYPYPSSSHHRVHVLTPQTCLKEL